MRRGTSISQLTTRRKGRYSHENVYTGKKRLEMAVTIRDVAREAGVSVATVSRVLNGKEPVRDETRRLILEISERLRYSPHSAARSLITRRTHSVGVLLPDLYGEFFSELIRGIDLAARRRGFHLLVSSSHTDATEIGVVVAAMRGRVDGLIVMWPDVDTTGLEAALPETLPTVLLNCAGLAGGFHALEIDNYGGAWAMVRHLVSLGHQRIALVSGPAKNYDAQERLRGYQDALARLTPGESPWILPGDFSEESGYEAGRVLVAAPSRPDAVFAANDAMAIGCLCALREAGLEVPRDIALAGFDDIPIARYMMPPLSSVGVSIADLGARALERLHAAVAAESPLPAERETVPTRLVVRSSCGAASPRSPR